MLRKDLVKNVTDLRQNPLELFRLARKKEKPLYVFHRSEPLGVVMSWEDFEDISRKANYHEAEDAREAVAIYQKEKQAGKLKTLQNVDELFE